MLHTLTSPHARAILWAQFRGMRNRLPRARNLGLVFTALIGILWYGIIAALAIAIGVLLAGGSPETVEHLLAGGLLLVLLYWLAVPVLLASKGASLELRKLTVYPIPRSEFFRLEMLLRLSAGVEPLMAVCGAIIGLLFNRGIPLWAPLALIVFVVFTTLAAAGTHDLLGRLMARKGVREVAALLFVLAVALPRLIVTRANLRHFQMAGTVTGWIGWPWIAAARIASGHPGVTSIAVLLAWTAAAYVFGRSQFERTLRSDGSESGAPMIRTASRSRIEWFFRWPNLLFADPVAAMVEKELRFLVRASRFRMVFVMGFSFGLLIWWPIAFGHTQRGGFDFIAHNFMTVVTLYAVLLLSDVLFWNAFGFDRSGAQLYFVVPVATATVLRAKNIAAGFFILLEATIALLICTIIRLPVTLQGVAEAYAVTIVATLLLLSIGNLTSLYSPRPQDPSKALRSTRSGRVQAMMLVIYPVVAIPLAMAYGARYAFSSELAFYGVLALALLFGAIAYHIAMESAVSMAEARKESIVAALSRGEGPVE